MALMSEMSETQLFKAHEKQPQRLQALTVNTFVNLSEGWVKLILGSLCFSNCRCFQTMRALERPICKGFTMTLKWVYTLQSSQWTHRALFNTGLSGGFISICQNLMVSANEDASVWVHPHED